MRPVILRRSIFSHYSWSQRIPGTAIPTGHTSDLKANYLTERIGTPFDSEMVTPGDNVPTVPRGLTTGQDIANDSRPDE